MLQSEDPTESQDSSFLQPQLSLIKFNSYRTSLLETALRQLLEKLPVQEPLHPGQRVVRGPGAAGQRHVLLLGFTDRSHGVQAELHLGHVLYVDEGHVHQRTVSDTVDDPATR